MSTSQQWLPTPQAAVAIGCSQNHLKRCRDSHGGFLVGGEDYMLGSSRSAAILWNVDAVRKAFHHRGMMARKAEAVMRELQSSLH